MAMKSKLTGPELKARRAAAEKRALYDSKDKGLVGGKTTETVLEEVFMDLSVGELDSAKDKIAALYRRERVNRWTFHPEA